MHTLLTRSSQHGAAAARPGNRRTTMRKGLTPAAAEAPKTSTDVKTVPVNLDELSGILKLSSLAHTASQMSQILSSMATVDLADGEDPQNQGGEAASDNMEAQASMPVLEGPPSSSGAALDAQEAEAQPTTPSPVSEAPSQDIENDTAAQDRLFDSAAASPTCGHEQEQALPTEAELALQAEPAEMHDSSLSRLLAMSNQVPEEMQREVWCMEDYEDLEELNVGYASSVYKARCKMSGNTVVLKVYKPENLDHICRHQLMRELRIHAKLNHPNIIRLYAAFEQGPDVVLVQEFADGGDLLHMMLKNNCRLDEPTTVNLVVKPILRALAYMHQKSIAHRDIKLENVLFADGDLKTLKLADFGLCINIREERSVTRAGTLDYMAPEVLKCPEKTHPEENKHREDLTYNPMFSDIWALAIMVYELLNGRPAFNQPDRDEMERMIVEAIAPEFVSQVSQEAIDFVHSCVQSDPTLRPSAWQLMGHPWTTMDWAPKEVSPMLTPRPGGRSRRGDPPSPGVGPVASSPVKQAVQAPLTAAPTPEEVQKEMDLEASASAALLAPTPEEVQKEMELEAKMERERQAVQKEMELEMEMERKKQVVQRERERQAVQSTMPGLLEEVLHEVEEGEGAMEEIVESSPEPEQDTASEPVAEAHLSTPTTETMVYECTAAVTAVPFDLDLSLDRVERLSLSGGSPEKKKLATAPFPKDLDLSLQQAQAIASNSYSKPKASLPMVKVPQARQQVQSKLAKSHEGKTPLAEGSEFNETLVGRVVPAPAIPFDLDLSLEEVEQLKSKSQSGGATEGTSAVPNELDLP